MYNKYFETDGEAFADLYRPVRESESFGVTPNQVNEPRKKDGFDLRRLLHGIDVDSAGILPIILLLLLLMDVEDDEKLIIVALAVIFGI